MTQRPIAEKYCEGKLKRMSKDKSKELETVPREQKEEVDDGVWFTRRSQPAARGGVGERRPQGTDISVSVATGVFQTGATP